MKRTRYTGEQIIGILTEHEAGAKFADLCRKHRMSEGTFYSWKAKFGRMTISVAKRLKSLEDENAKLKKLLAEQMLDAAAMKELLSKNGRARHEARNRCASAGQAWPVGTAVLSDCWSGSQDDPLPVRATTRDRAAPAASGSHQ
jgi:putative transposase